MKYKDCTSLEELATVNSNYLEQDIDDGCWFYQLPRLENGDNMFYNDDMTELYEGRVPLWHFESNLQSLQSGVNMFKGCALDAVSVKRIADTLSSTSPGTITLGIHYALEGDSGVVASLAKIENKGWSVETEYNLPYGFTELEYLESSGTQYLQFDLNYSSNDSLTLRYVVTPYNATSQYYNRAWGSASGVGFGSGFSLASTITLGETSVGQTLYWGNSGMVPFPYVRVGEEITAVFSPDGLFVQGVRRRNAPTVTLAPIIKPFQLFTYETRYLATMRWCGFSNERNNKKLINLIPVLDASGTPCMYDTVSHSCIYNNGAGKFGYRIKITGKESEPFSLRDPYYTAPSGVYARLVAENELDIVADTDMKEDAAEQYGYTWFANTGEAYEQFGITQQSEEGEVIDA